MSVNCPKVLIVAEHASATFGGEALLPYQYFKRLRKRGVDVHLLVHHRTKKELDDAFPDENDRLHYVADSALNAVCHKISRYLPDRIATFTVGALSHLDTQLRQRRLARLLHKKYRYDVIHEPIPVSPKLPSALFGIPAPVIIGPMNGGMDYPEHYKIERTAERWIFAWLRRAAVLANFLLPGKRRAALLLVANERTRQALPANVKSRRVTELVENGVDTSLFRPNLAFKTETNGLHLIHVGRLVDFKRVDLVIDACSKLPENFSFHLDLVGDGPLREDLEAKAKRLLSTKVTFHGRLQQSAAAELLRNADVMLFASMRESGGAVLLEAMSSAVPVIAANWGGPADYITPETGILIPPATPSRFIDAMAEAILWMAEHPERRAAMGRAGRKRSEELYDWTQKTALILQIYSDVVSRAEFERLRADDR